MIEVSYKDFYPGSGNIELDSIEGKLKNLFMEENKIKLQELDKVYKKDEFNDLAKEIYQLLETDSSNRQNIPESEDTSVQSQNSWIYVAVAVFIIYIISCNTNSPTEFRLEKLKKEQEIWFLRRN